MAADMDKPVDFDYQTDIEMAGHLAVGIVVVVVDFEADNHNFDYLDL